MKVIFLDIDGVLVTAHSTFSNNVPNFRQTCVQCLNTIVERTGAVIVVSSTWRHLHPRHRDLDVFFRQQHVRTPIHDMTPRLLDRDVSRGQEIGEWLRSRDDVEAFVILDDDGDMDELVDHLVRTDFDTGLGPEHVKRVIEILEEI